MTLDEGSFYQYGPELVSQNPLNFPEYMEKLEQDMKRTGLKEAVITGEGRIKGYPVVIGVMDSRFRMASMGSVVGEKLTRAIEQALEKRYPVIIIFCIWRGPHAGRGAQFNADGQNQCGTE